MGERMQDRFPPHVLREYSFLADGERGAMVGPRGEIGWMCAPRWHDDAIFSALLGGTGMYAITPADPRFVWGGYYENGTLIWHSRWVTDSGIIECRDTLAMPGDLHRAIILRRVTAISGNARVRTILDVRAGFGRYRMSRVSHAGGVWSARSGGLHLRWVGAPGASAGEAGLEQVIDVNAGDHHDLVLEVSDQSLPRELIDADREWAATENVWRQEVPSLDNTIAPDDARQSYAVLRGMTSSSGGMVAAATMSLPERADEGRNYDYRYAWIRDQCFAGQAVAACGSYPLIDSGVRFVSERMLEHGPGIKPAYTVAGDGVPGERHIKVPGYPGGSDIAGNRANSQFQLDALGESLLLFAAAARHDRLNLENWRAVDVCVDAIRQLWREPDCGIWELLPDQWTHSKLICVAGLRQIAALAPAAQGGQWVSLADSILAAITPGSLHPTGRWQRTPDDERVDAALLLPAIRGALPSNDPRSVATVDAVRSQLGRDGFLYRFSQDSRPLMEAEGAFLLSGFHLAMALNDQGDAVGAARWFERNRTACGSPGLFTEEFDVQQRQLRGNIPQAFVHAGLIESARRLAEPVPDAAG